MQLHENEIIITNANIDKLTQTALVLDDNAGQAKGPYLRALNEQCLRQEYDK